MPAFLQPYAKAVVAFAAFSIALGLKHWLGGTSEDVTSFFIQLGTDETLAALSTWGVYAVRNTTPGQ